MRIAILVFDKLTALDAIGPYEVLSRLPEAELRFVAKEPGTVRSDTGALVLEAEHSLSENPDPDVLLIPGGEGNRPLLADEVVLDWIRAAHETSTWTTSVCTGSLVLGAAGVLKGLRATSHWAYAQYLPAFGAEFAEQRVVEDGKVMTAAGVSSGIDMALVLADRLAGRDAAERIQLEIEYDPEPPFDAGSPGKARPEVVELARAGESTPVKVEPGA
jgi:putative intracellular protease/amidase